MTRFRIPRLTIFVLYIISTAHHHEIVGLVGMGTMGRCDDPGVTKYRCTTNVVRVVLVSPL